MATDHRHDEPQPAPRSMDGEDPLPEELALGDSVEPGGPEPELNPWTDVDEPELLDVDQVLPLEPPGLTTLGLGLPPALPALPRRAMVFGLARHRYAVDVTQVAEVEELLPVTPVPALPEWLLGVMNLRGEILSVVDLRSFAGFELPPARRVLIVHSEDGKTRSAFVVDGIEGLTDLEMDRLEPLTLGRTASEDGDESGPYRVRWGRLTDYVVAQMAYGEDSVPLLDLSRLLVAQELIELPVAAGAAKAAARNLPSEHHPEE